MCATVGTATDSSIDGPKLNMTGGETKITIDIGKTEGQTEIAFNNSDTKARIGSALTAARARR